MKKMKVAQLMIRGAREALAHKRGKLRGAKVTRAKLASSFPATPRAERSGPVEYSVVHATLLRPLPFADADRLAIVWGVVGPDRDIRGGSPPEIADWAGMTTSFEGLTVYDETSLTLSGLGAARRLETETVSATYFDLLRAE